MLFDAAEPKFMALRWWGRPVGVSSLSCWLKDSQLLGSGNMELRARNEYSDFVLDICGDAVIVSAAASCVLLIFWRLLASGSVVGHAA